MSRLIKFRAWHKFAHKMANIDMLDFMLDAYRATSGKSSGSGHMADIELMQFTGFLDRNGKEVYEGDIIREENGDIWAIRWNRDLAQFALYWHDSAKLESNKEWRYEDSLGALVVSVYEVIGNMYETPELLETSKGE